MLLQVQVCHPSPTHGDGHWGCSQFGAMRNEFATDILCVTLGTHTHTFTDMHTCTGSSDGYAHRGGISASGEAVHLGLTDLFSKLFPNMVAPVIFSTSSQQGVWFTFALFY